MKPEKNTLVVIYIAIALAVGIFVGFKLNSLLESKKQSELPVASPKNMFEIRESGYRYISPLWDCDCVAPSDLNSLTQLDSTVRSYTNACNQSGKTSNIAVYFRDMNNGPWIGINEDVAYAPASLLKVPIMIAAFKMAENNPAFLEKKIRYNTPVDTTHINLSDSLHIVPGHYYTIQNLIEYMIIGSDNNAKQLVLNEIGDSYFFKIMQDLGINPSSNSDFVSVRMYSSFFRVLYNASYLNKQYSETALEILSRSSFKSGIAAHIPPGITVANKFGERDFYGSTVKQLHDCGIIYHPQHPYLLCVMTRGNDFETQRKVISDISKIIYDGVESGKFNYD